MFCESHRSSRHLLYGETSCMHCSGVILAGPFKQLYCSFSETNGAFPWLCLGSSSCWNTHPRFIFIILVDSSRFLSQMSRYIFLFILPSIIWSVPVLHAEEQPHTLMFPPPNFTDGMVFLGWYAAPFDLQTWCVIMASKEFKFGSIWPDYMTKCFSANFKRASTFFFFSNGVSCGEYAYRPRQLSALLIVFFETIVPAGSKSFCSSPQVVLGSWTGREHLVMAGLLWNDVLSTSRLWPQQCSLKLLEIRL